MWPCPHRLYHWCKITTSLRNFTTHNYWTTKRRTWWELLTSTKEKINIICVLSTGDPFLSSTQWLTRWRVVSTFSIWWMIVRKTKQLVILGSVCGECCPLCTLKASLIAVEKKAYRYCNKTEWLPRCRIQSNITLSWIFWSIAWLHMK